MTASTIQWTAVELFTGTLEAPADDPHLYVPHHQFSVHFETPLEDALSRPLADIPPREPLYRVSPQIELAPTLTITVTGHRQFAEFLDVIVTQITDLHSQVYAHVGDSSYLTNWYALPVSPTEYRFAVDTPTHPTIVFDASVQQLTSMHDILCTHLPR